MPAGQTRKLFTADWCFAGVILFFIVHGYSENQFLVPVKELLLLFFILLAIGIAAFFLFKKIFRSGSKSAIFTAVTFLIILFFGAIQDSLAMVRFLSSLTRLTVLLPVCLIVLLLFFLWVKRTKASFKKAILFFNLLLFFSVLVDMFIISYRFISPPKNRDRELVHYALTNCDTCQEPPVYFILLDSYYGSAGLKAFFDYDNSDFENFLKAKGFHVGTASHSNYYYTLYSMASLMNMDYLHEIDAPVIKNHYGYNRATAGLRNNIVCRYFANLGYRINNYSIFDLPGVPAGYNSGLLPDKIQLITQQTLYYRIKKYLPPFLIRIGWLKEVGEDIENEYIDNNEKMIADALAESKSKNAIPAFTYLHLMMPHGPFIFDSVGNRTHVMQHYSSLSSHTLDNMFLQYQVYTNKRISKFITELQKETAGNAVIILMSDHGYQPAYKKEKKLAYYNLNAVYLPSGKYKGWYDGMSNVNQFRVLFNTLYNQKLPLLRDSMVTQ